MKSRDVIIIGGGAAGMLAAISAAKSGAGVTLIEKMERLGRKLRITGKGRCNITNTKPWQEFSTHIHPKSNFFKHSFYNFSNNHTIEFFESIGLKTSLERGERIFPSSGLAADVVIALTSEMERLGVEVLLNTRVTDLYAIGQKITEVVTLNTNSNIETKYSAVAVILATGGLTYPLTGSDGDGYAIAKKLGHKIEECFPSLTALMPKEYSKELEGLQLKNVEISLFIAGDEVQREMGDLDFTNNGIEGSIGYKISRKAVKALINGNRCVVYLDLKPALTKDVLEERMRRELDLLHNPSINQLMRKLVPYELISSFLSFVKLPADPLKAPKREATIKAIAASLKAWKMDIVTFTSYERAVITAGGVSLDEVIAKSMRSRLYVNLFFAGEIIDLDGDTGGYNLQIAFSTGYMAGLEAARFSKGVIIT
ncbi:MAG: aminoacetone oxidase family FAD-binding enzyme [Bacteroidales bacterium]|nr:aminoacetone oxidase family FAD-binding enzyme [Bacteroidales bacterium]